MTSRLTLLRRSLWCCKAPRSRRLSTPMTDLDRTPVETKFFDFPDDVLPFKLQNGETLSGVTLAYQTYGELNADKSNVILLFHALTGSQNPAGINRSVPGVDLWSEECQTGWWPGWMGQGEIIDTDRFFVLCVNYLGGCYGSTGPSSINPDTGRRYGGAFPEVTLSDIVDSQMVLLDELGIERVHTVIGPSVGGMMCVSMATRYPERIERVVPVASGLFTSPLQFIYNFEQTSAILNDPNFQQGDYYDGPRPDQGLSLARMIGHKTFVSLEAMESRARGEVTPGIGPAGYQMRSPLESYMWHQGQKFLERFDANTYIRLMTAWQHFDLLEEAGATDMTDLLKHSRGHRYLLFSIDSDVCFYPEEQAAMLDALRHAGVAARRVVVSSEKGHDSFLLEPHLFADSMVDFLA